MPVGGAISQTSFGFDDERHKQLERQGKEKDEEKKEAL